MLLHSLSLFGTRNFNRRIAQRLGVGVLDCCIDHVLAEHFSLLHEMQVQKFNVTNLAAIFSLFENASNYVIYRIELGTFWRS